MGTPIPLLHLGTLPVPVTEDSVRALVPSNNLDSVIQYDVHADDGRVWEDWMVDL